MAIYTGVGSGIVHLKMYDSSDTEPKLVTEGRFGCDYSWNKDYSAYCCNPHKWLPGDSISYLACESGGDYVDHNGHYSGDDSVPAIIHTQETIPVVLEDGIPF